MLLRWSRYWVSMVLALSVSPLATSDEGMWLYNDLPRQTLRSRHDFDPSDAWAQHLMLSSVRFNSGGSGSFISSDGLVLTNHHVASDTLYKLSTPERNINKDGYLAESLAEELKAPDLELNQLVEIIDVTDQVNAAVKPDLDKEAAAKARQAVMAEIEKESLDKTTLRSDVVTLYGGAKYHLYRYKKYTDIRLVFAPEAAIAFFGGDADNFEYPRFCLDMTILRVYENDQPAKLEHYLKWSDKAISDNELVFVSGHPGRTQRIFTVEALEYLRDDRIPSQLDLLRRKEILMQQFGLAGAEAKRRAQDDLFGIQNSRKAYSGMIAGLQDPRVMAGKLEKQRKIIDTIATQPDGAVLAQGWKEIAALQADRRKLLRKPASFRTQSYFIAETLNLMAVEDAKPNPERMRELRESNRESLLQELLSDAPLYSDLETVKLADDLARLAEMRGGNDPIVKAALAGLSPQERAVSIIANTKLMDVAARKALIDGGMQAIAGSKDPLIELARQMEPEMRAIRKETDRIEEAERQAYAKIAEAINRVEGTGTYPDATFTLRLAFGSVKGYQEDGKSIPPWTTLGGAFKHEADHGSEGDYKLPQSWTAAKDQLNAGTPFNFVCTADIIGGNSGSPVVNRAGELVGLIFDGNIQSLTADYLFSDTQGRAVAVAGVGIKEALRKVYKAPSLADSIGK
jgi:hypothetical protein